MKTTISTKSVDLARRSRHWHETIARAYFPLDLTFPRPEAFNGGSTASLPAGPLAASACRA